LFQECIDFVDDGKAKGYATLIHCAAGVSRSATLCIAYLINKGGSAQESLKFVQQRRPIVCPNEGFRRQLVEYDHQLHPSTESANKTEVDAQYLDEHHKCTLL